MAGDDEKVGLGVVVDRESAGNIVISKIISGGPADAARGPKGVRVGSVILSADGVIVRDKSIPELAEILKGPVDSVAELRVLHTGATAATTALIRRFAYTQPPPPPAEAPRTPQQTEADRRERVAKALGTPPSQSASPAPRSHHSQSPSPHRRGSPGAALNTSGGSGGNRSSSLSPLRRSGELRTSTSGLGTNAEESIFDRLQREAQSILDESMASAMGSPHAPGSSSKRAANLNASVSSVSSTTAATTAVVSNSVGAEVHVSNATRNLLEDLDRRRTHMHAHAMGECEAHEAAARAATTRGDMVAEALSSELATVKQKLTAAELNVMKKTQELFEKSAEAERFKAEMRRAQDELSRASVPGNIGSVGAHSDERLNKELARDAAEARAALERRVKELEASHGTPAEAQRMFNVIEGQFQAESSRSKALEAKVTDLTREVNTAGKRVADAKQETKDMADEAERARDQTAAAERRCTVLEQQVETITDLRKAVQGRLDTSLMNEARLTTRIGTLEGDLAQSMQQRQRAEARVSSLEEESQTLRKKLHTADTYIVEKTNAGLKLQEQLNAANAKLVELQKHVDQNASVVSGVERQLESANREKSNAVSRCDAVERELETTRRELRQVEARLAGSPMSSPHRGVGHNDSTNSGGGDAYLLSPSRADPKAMSEEIIRLRKRCEDLSSKLDDVRDSAANAAKSPGALSGSEAAALRRRYEDLVVELEEARQGMPQSRLTELRDACTMAADAKAHAADLSERLDAVKATLVAREEDILALRQQLESVSNDDSVANERLRHAEDAVEQAELACATAKASESEMFTQLAERDDQVFSLRDKVSLLEASLEETKQQLQNAQSDSPSSPKPCAQCPHLRGQTVALEKRLRNEEESNSTLKAELTAATEVHAGCSARAATLESDLYAAREEAASLTAAVARLNNARATDDDKNATVENLEAELKRARAVAAAAEAELKMWTSGGTGASGPSSSNAAELIDAEKRVKAAEAETFAANEELAELKDVRRDLEKLRSAVAAGTIGGGTSSVSMASVVAERDALAAELATLKDQQRQRQQTQSAAASSPASSSTLEDAWPGQGDALLRASRAVVTARHGFLAADKEVVDARGEVTDLERVLAEAGVKVDGSEPATDKGSQLQALHRNASSRLAAAEKSRHPLALELARLEGQLLKCSADEKGAAADAVATRYVEKVVGAENTALELADARRLIRKLQQELAQMKAGGAAVGGGGAGGGGGTPSRRSSISAASPMSTPPKPISRRASIASPSSGATGVIKLNEKTVAGGGDLGDKAKRTLEAAAKVRRASAASMAVNAAAAAAAAAAVSNDGGDGVGEICGLGFRLAIDPKTHLVKIKRVLEDCPVQNKQHIKEGDTVAAIDGKILKGVPGSELGPMLTGPRGSSTKFVLVRAGREKTVDLHRLWRLSASSTSSAVASPSASRGASRASSPPRR